MNTSKLTFAYLLYTTNSLGTILLGVYKSSKAAKTYLDLVNGEYVPIGKSNRVLQKLNQETGQFWYVEKHVLRDGL